ncbi:MAG: hypothetical protein EA360_06670 [Balneolaceae bacterium]|nr:MAG: hypothetical protein EA360_06670 [Balneolaceae bacterium]
MKIDSFIPIAEQKLTESRREELRQEKAAVDVEKIFARHLIQELTKNTFKMAESDSPFGSSNSVYREFITDALADQLAAEKRLGMADMISKYWDTSKEQIK